LLYWRLRPADEIFGGFLWAAGGPWERKAIKGAINFVRCGVSALGKNLGADAEIGTAST